MNSDATVSHNLPEERKWMRTLKLILSYSFRMVLSWLVVFAIAKVFHLERVIYIRFINYLVMFFVAYSMLKKLYTEHNNKMEYFSGMAITFSVGVVASIIYAILFFIYLHLDKTFTDYLIDQFPRKMLYPELSIAFVIFSEGFSFSVIIALSLLQYFKRKRGRWTVSDK